MLRDRVARGIALRARVLRHRGDRVECPLCGSRFQCFKANRNRPEALCWRCGAHERHRALGLLLKQRPELLGEAGSLLHFAPEWCLRRWLSGLGHLRYVTTDPAMAEVDLRLDITRLALPDSSFDAVLCSHVLEHVEDDSAAMRELRRITAPDGWCIVMVPLDLGRDETYEDPAISTEAERELAFWQRDHVRLYGLDFGERLAAAGYAVQRIEPLVEFGAEVVDRCGLLESDYMWLCRPRAA